MKQIIFFILSIISIENLSAEILTVTNTNDYGSGSLRSLANIANSGDSIIFDKSLAGKTIELQGGINLSWGVSVSGKNASVILSGGNRNGIFSGGKSIDNLTFINAPTAISNCPLVFDCTFKNCKFIKSPLEPYGTAIDGGAISSIYSSITVTNCTFENNTADHGGAICSFNSLIVTNCIFKNNISFEGGGAIFSGDSLTVTNCIFENNTTANYGYGGAISSNGTTTITECKFSNNTAGGYGGAICSQSSYDCSLTVSNCTFESNTSNYEGGAIYSNHYPSTIPSTVTNCTFKDNTAEGRGGAIFAYFLTVTNCTFKDNSVNSSIPDGGGAIYGCAIKGNIFIDNKIMPLNILNDVRDCGSLGYNVYTSNQNTVFSQSTDYRYTGSEALLVSLGNYGGNTATMPINTAIPNWETIVRRVPVSTERTTDQRGLPVPTTGLVCAGAVEMQANEHYTGIADIKKEQINVFPNPASDIIHLVLEDNSNVQVYDAFGKLIKEQSCKTGKNEINISDFPQGLYLLNVNGKTSKIIKK